MIFPCAYFVFGYSHFIIVKESLSFLVSCCIYEWLRAQNCPKMATVSGPYHMSLTELLPCSLSLWHLCIILILHKKIDILNNTIIYTL